MAFGEDFMQLLKDLDDQYFGTKDRKYSGFTPREIAEIQKAQDVECLPETYIQFLLYTGDEKGKCLNRFAKGLGELYDLKSYKQALGRMLEHEHGETLTLPAGAFVFYREGWGGENSFFFVTDKCLDDPPVYYYYEGNTGFLEVSSHLSKWFTEQALYRKDNQLGGPIFWLHDNKSDELKKVCPPSARVIDDEDEIPF